MKTKYAAKKNTLPWILMVYALSLISYLPVLAERCGVVLPSFLLYLKYLFVCIPAVTAVIVLVSEKNLGSWLREMFSGSITMKTVVMWLLWIATGMLISFCYRFATGINVFENTYPSAASLLGSCIYLFITGFVEEIAWRGFLLERISLKVNIPQNVLITGVAWAAWHLPMWTIRNQLGIEQIIFYFIWTLLVSLVLGTAFYQCRNVLSAAILHMIFNVCYLASVQYNIVILTAVMLIGIWIEKKNGTRTFKPSAVRQLPEQNIPEK